MLLKDARFCAVDLETTGLNPREIVLVELWLGQQRGKKDCGLSLDDIANSYGLEEYYRHNAMADAFYVAQIFQMQMKRLTHWGIDSVWSLKQVLRSWRHHIWPDF